MTNYQQITRMSVKELAKYLVEQTVFIPYAGSRSYYKNFKTNDPNCDYKTAVRETEEWLSKKVDK